MKKKAVKKFSIANPTSTNRLKSKTDPTKKNLFALNGLKPFRSIFFSSLVTFIINKTSTLKYPNSEFVVNYNINYNELVSQFDPDLVNIQLQNCTFMIIHLGCLASSQNK